jgi:hypothetical protein
MVTLHRIYQPYNRLPPRRVRVRTALRLETLSAVCNFPNFPTSCSHTDKYFNWKKDTFHVLSRKQVQGDLFICTKSKASLSHVCCSPSHIIHLARAITWSLFQHQGQDEDSLLTICTSRQWCLNQPQPCLRYLGEGRIGGPGLDCFAQDGLFRWAFDNKQISSVQSNNTPFLFTGGSLFLSIINLPSLSLSRISVFIWH